MLDALLAEVEALLAEQRARIADLESQVAEWRFVASEYEARLRERDEARAAATRLQVELDGARRRCGLAQALSVAPAGPILFAGGGD